MTRVFRVAIALAILVSATTAFAEDGANPCPSGTVASGSSSVTVDGKQAARAGDSAGCAGTITEGSPDVFIEGKPAPVQGAKTGCGGKVASGPTGVFVNGKPFVIAGSAADCPTIGGSRSPRHASVAQPLHCR